MKRTVAEMLRREFPGHGATVLWQEGSWCRIQMKSQKDEFRIQNAGDVSRALNKLEQMGLNEPA